MNLFVGTSGYSYEAWKGPWYPADLPAAEMLRYYGERFRSVEINNTFYRMPKPAVLESWLTQVPRDFRFVIKASRRITHMQRLKEVDESVAYLLKVTAALGDQLGPILFQLPPNLKKDVPRLAAFLALLPRTQRVVLEMRNATWFDDEVLALLKDHGAALCLTEAEEGVAVPFVATAPWGYLRLRRTEYTDQELAEWLARIREQHWEDVFVFFMHEDEALGPRFGERFLALAKA